MVRAIEMMMMMMMKKNKIDEKLDATQCISNPTTIDFSFYIFTLIFTNKQTNIQEQKKNRKNKKNCDGN
jgi:hypothetical protein